VSGTTKRGEEDEESDDERGDKKVKRKDVPEMPRKTRRTANDVVELLEFSGKEGHGIVTNVVQSYLECHETASFVHSPMLHLDEVKVTIPTHLFASPTSPTGRRCVVLNIHTDVVFPSRLEI
jgi:hypothetical protein